MNTAQHILNLPLAEGREASSKSWGRKWGYSRPHCGGPTEAKSCKEHQPIWSQRHRGDRTLVWYSLTCWWTLLQNYVSLWEVPRMVAEGEEVNSLPALTGSIIAPHHCSCHHCHHHHTIPITTPSPSPHHPHHHHPHHHHHPRHGHHARDPIIPATLNIPTTAVTITANIPIITSSPPLPPVQAGAAPCCGRGPSSPRWQVRADNKQPCSSDRLGLEPNQHFRGDCGC